MSVVAVILITWAACAVKTSAFLYLPEEIPQPDLTLIAVVYLTLRWGGMRGAIAAFVLGAGADSFAGFAVGLGQTSCVSLFVVLVLFRGKLLIESPMSEVFITFAAGALYGVFLRFFGHNLLNLVSPAAVGWLNILAIALVSATFAPIFFALFRFAERLAGEGRERELVI